MRRSPTTCRVLASFVFLLVVTTVAHAQLAYRTWVAGNGNDVNPCTHALPCQTFAVAILQTRAGGEINAKSAGEFGPVFIDKSITIDGGGTFSGIVSGGIPSRAITVDDSATATPNTAVVTLRNLSINGAGPTLGSDGVEFISGKTLNIENCKIFNFSHGVMVNASGNVNIKNTSIFNSTSGVTVGENIPFPYATVSLNACNIEQNTTAGVNLLGDGYASIRDSVIQFNGKGVWLQSIGNTVNIMGSQINHNTTGLYLLLATDAAIGSSTFMSNSTNFISSGGHIRTFGNNQTETAIPGVVTNLGLR